MFFVSNLQSYTQAGRRGFEPVSRSIESVPYRQSPVCAPFVLRKLVDCR
jgi:hypothetical protein